ncbi:hypothetical protein JXL21_09925 [Candidatus Bathyarchaeota archaeon]|nr:hypothetical protein [Candidatus Bathyarchaeota archaeon]
MPRCPHCNHEFDSSIKYALPSEQELIERNRAVYRKVVWYKKFGWLGLVGFFGILFMSIDIWRNLSSEGLGYIYGLGFLFGVCIVASFFYSLNYFQARSSYQFLTERMEGGGYDTKKMGRITFLDGFILKKLYSNNE